MSGSKVKASRGSGPSVWCCRSSTGICGMILRFDSQPRIGPVPYDLSAASSSGLSQQANLLRKNNNYAYLHTLACLDAARGETAEARQLLLEATSTGNMEEPNSAIWYGFGRIYEQYGVYDAAAAAYQRVERPDGVIEPTDIFVLAQSRLKALHRN